MLSSPPTCGPNTSGARLTPYSGNAAATPTQSFVLQKLPGGGACPTSLGARPFAPSFAAAPKSNAAGAYSPLHIGYPPERPAGAESGDDPLAPGMIGKLAGIPYCPENALAAAAPDQRRAQTAHSSCPVKERSRHRDRAGGTGPTPLPITGKVFLAGPYHGPPLSLAVITPATAGPFDLGTVVVRVALLSIRRRPR